MLSSRSMPPEAWAKAREALVFYFSRRHASDRAEDLAQETLTAVWNRGDYEFEKESDFPRVCLGFARLISQAGHRRAQRDLSQPSGVAYEVAAPHEQAGGAGATESRILLEQVCQLGQARLRDRDWQLVLQAATADSGSSHVPADQRNKFRVSLHRARKRLEQITGWRNR